MKVPPQNCTCTMGQSVVYDMMFALSLVPFPIATTLLVWRISKFSSFGLYLNSSAFVFYIDHPSEIELHQ